MYIWKCPKVNESYSVCQIVHWNAKCKKSVNNVCEIRPITYYRYYFGLKWATGKYTNVLLPEQNSTLTIPIKVFTYWSNAVAGKTISKEGRGTYIILLFTIFRMIKYTTYQIRFSSIHSYIMKSEIDTKLHSGGRSVVVTCCEADDRQPASTRTV